MALRRSLALKNAQLTTGSLYSLLNDGILVIFSGTRPASAEDDENLYDESTNPTGNKELLRITVSGGAYDFETGTNGLTFTTPASGGILTKTVGEIWTGMGTAVCGDGATATWFRFYAPGGSAGTALTVSSHVGEDLAEEKIRLEGSCGTFGDLQMASTTIAQGQSVTLDTFALSIGD